MNPCCVCLEDTDDNYDCMVCKEGRLCWTCWEKLYEESGYDDSIYTPCPICKSNLNYRRLVAWNLVCLFDEGCREGLEYEGEGKPVFEKFMEWKDAGLLR